MATENNKTALIKNLKVDAIMAGGMATGLIIGHLGTTLNPMQNKLLKTGITFAVGAGSLLIPMKDGNLKNFVKPALVGVTVYGFLSLLRAALVGDSVTAEGQAGIAGIGNSESVQKIVNMLLPNLGDSSPMSVSSFSDQVYDIEEPSNNSIEDQDAVVMNGLDDMAELGDSNDMDALGGMDDFDSLSGGYDQFENELY